MRCGSRGPRAGEERNPPAVFGERFRVFSTFARFALAEAGRLGIFTPMYIVYARKPDLRRSREQARPDGAGSITGAWADRGWEARNGGVACLRSVPGVQRKAVPVQVRDVHPG